MGKRKHSAADSETKRSKNPFILDDVEEVDEDYESDYDEAESVGDSVEASAKRIKKSRGESTKRKSGEGKAMSRELAAAIKETERREKDRQNRQVNKFATMSVEELQAYAIEHYGEMTGEEEDDTEEGDGIEIEDDDYSDDEDDMSGYIGDLFDRGFNLWMVRCAKRKERVNVKKIKRRIKQLKKKETPLPIAHTFFHKEITGLFWVEAKSRKDLMEALRDCEVPCAEKNIKMVPSEELGATYSPRPRASEENKEIVNFKVGDSVCITRGEHLGHEGMIVDMDEDTVTVILADRLPDIDTRIIRRDNVRPQDG